MIFTLDAIFALMVLSAAVPLVAIAYFQSVSPYAIHGKLSVQSEDAATVLVKITTGEELNESPVLQQLLAEGKIRQSDLDRPLIDTIGMFWSANTTQDAGIAQSIVLDALGNTTPASASWQAFFSDDEVAANFTAANSSIYSIATSKRMVSGFEKNRTLEGCVARAFLEHVAGRRDAKYYFFGGFAGQGNLTAVVEGVPGDANVSYIYLEANLGSNVSLYLNGNFCANLPKTGGPLAVDNFTLTNASHPQCIGNVSKGADNVFFLNFSGNDSAIQFVGGGFLKIAFDSSLLSYQQANSTRYRFPGIAGLINLYDSFHVPGNITNITAHLDYYADTELYLTIGNTTVFNRSASGSLQNFTIGNASFGANFSNDYLRISGKTVPLRLGTTTLLSGNATGNADVILITDISGSMSWRIDSDSTSGANASCTDCSDPCMNLSTVLRINKAKCLDKEFVDTILNLSGNRIGLAAFTSSADAYFEELTTDADYLKGRIDAYSAGGGTCVCCAINRAYQLANQSHNYSLINRSSSWQYNAAYPDSEPPLDAQGRNWTDAAYNVSWSQGTAPLGFGGVTTDIGDNLQAFGTKQQNSSGYALATGTVSAGTLGDTNISDSATFDLQEASNGTSRAGMAAFQLSAQAATPKYSVWDGSSWGASANAQATGGGTVRWAALASSPSRNEKLLATLDSQSDVYAQVWGGASWGTGTLMTATAPNAARRQFDVAYEQLSGDAMVVYINGTNQQIQYRVWDGNAWGAESLLAVGTASTANARVKLYSHNGSDELMLLVETEATSTYADLYAARWDGSAFGAPAQIETSIGDLNGQDFDGAWEPAGSQFVLFYANTASNIRYRTYSAGSWSSAASGFSGGSGAIRNVRAAAYPGTENVMACWQEFSAADLDCQMWDGTQLGTGRERETSMEAYATTRNFDVAPVLGTGGFVVMFGNSNADWYDFYMCNSAANCFSGTYTTSANSPINLWSGTQLGGTDTSWGSIYADPNNPGNLTLVGASQTASGGWYRSQIYCNSTSCYSQGNWASLGGAASSIAYEGAAFAFGTHPAFGLDARFNATFENAADFGTLNATMVFNSTQSSQYQLGIYNFYAGAWETSPCQGATAAPTAWATLSCNVTQFAQNYLSAQNTSSFRLVQSGGESQATAKIDFVQFYASNASGNYYFRKTFSIADNSTIEYAAAFVYSDDAAEVYVNGILVDSDAGAHPAAYWNRVFNISASAFVKGNNTVAVKLGNADAESAKFDFGLNASQKRNKFIILMTDGQTGYQCSASSCFGNATTGYNSCGASCTGTSCDCAIDNANYSACRSRALPSTVYSIGFGPVSTCSNGNKTLQRVAECGGGAYYYSSDAAELQDIYANLAQAINNQSVTFVSQAANVTGIASNMTLYPGSYIEFQYSPNAQGAGFRQISLSAETDAFNGCNGSFFVPPADSIDGVKVTSYSAGLWTSRVDAKNASNPWQAAFNLSEYAASYKTLGDPFVVGMDARLFATNATNYVNITTGSNSTNSSATCSNNSKAIYTFRITLPSSFSPTLANCTSRNVTVYYDKDGDGAADGNVNISYGSSPPATPAGPDMLDAAADAGDYAFLVLMDGLNLDNLTNSVSITSGRSGTQANPIDFQIPESTTVDATPLSGIPFMWGPAEVKVTMRT
jgi:hypothetical protein